MLGIYRYILAFMVACSHLWNELMWWQGTYAVFCFYLISGYLMSKIINEVYVGKNAHFRYMANRLLRIYPLYLVVLILTIIVVSIFPNVSGIEIGHGFSFSNFMKLPDEPQNWLANISLLYPFESQLTITQAWSLRVELVYYFALIFLSRNIKIVICWLLFSAIYILYLEYSFAPFNEKYNTVFGASISFSLGALTYHLSKKISLGKSHLYIALVLFSMHLWFAPDIWNFSRENIGFDMLFKPEHYGLYSCIILGAYLLLAIISNDVNSQLSSLGVYFGYLAYSVFLIHWVVAIFVVGIGISFDEKLNFLLVSFALINIISLALYWFIERPINNNIRFKLREG